MASYFDDNDLRNISEENLRYFYEEYSASVRKQLLSKNLVVPQNVYDVLYPRTKEALMAKNISKEIDLEENSKAIRDSLISKLVSENLDLEKLSEDTRKSLIARNKLIVDADALLQNTETHRKLLLSKNVQTDSNLLGDSDAIRRNNTTKNVVNPSVQKNFEKSNEEFRTNSLSKNQSTQGDLLNDSISYRDNALARNTSELTDIEKESVRFRDGALSKNKSTGQDLESISSQFRSQNQANNVPVDPVSILETSESYRTSNLSKNSSTITDISALSDEIRTNNLKQNKSTDGDLEKDSASFRDKNLSNNVDGLNTIDKNSESIRQGNISRNKSTGFDAQAFADEIRINNLSRNKTTNGDLLNDSEEFRKKELSNNSSKEGDLLGESKTYLENNAAANKPTGGDLLSDSEKTLQKNISANKPSGGDLLSDSESFLQNNIAPNKPGENNFDNISDAARKNLLANNKVAPSDILNDSENYFQNNVSANKPSGGDLLSDSESFLQNNTASNKPAGGDLLSDSESFLANNIAPNKPTGGDLLLDSEGFLANNTAPNVPNSGDLLLDSEDYLENNLGPNVPSGGDLLLDSEEYLDNNLASNVPSGGDLLTDSGTYLTGNLASNVPSGGDLLNDSGTYLQNNLSSNVPAGGDLLNDSSDFRDNLLAGNNIKPFDLESISKGIRDKNLSANPPASQLGVVVEGLGTAAFLGVSRVLVQGLVLRQVLLSKNKSSKYNVDKFVSASSLDKSSADEAKNTLIAKNQFQLGPKEYGTFSANLIKGDRTSILGSTVRDLTQGQLNQNQFYNNSVAKNLQDKYGSNSTNNSSSASVGGGFFSVDTIGPKGGYYSQDDAMQEVKFDVRFNKGSITDAIRNYNLSRNLYNLYKLTPGDLDSLTTLQANNDEGFQGLLAKTVGSLKGNDSVGSQLQGNLIPRGILVANEGAYIKGGSPENILRPQQAQGMQVGSPESMMSKTVAGNPFLDTEFQAGTKGVKHIMKTIKNSAAADFTINYDVQNSRKFVIGVNNDGSPKVARQRYTVANPYKPGSAKTLLFYIQNYSSGEGFYFPPYIQDFSESFGANWNAVNFLGRPEPIYTYNNSSREGSISFFVLTDYTQNLLIGRNYNSDSLDEVKVNPRVHFTSKDSTQNENRKLAFNQGEAKQKETNKTAQEYNAYNNLVSGGTPEKNVLQKDITNLQRDSNSIQKTQDASLVDGNKGNVYSETNNVIGNINNFMTTLPSRDAGDIDTKAEDSKKRIDEMTKNLAFQPAFFSGDKVDFTTKMEFLGKLTRPAKADEGSGFSFTKPPVCHLHLGDWWNSDVIIESVSCNYTDAPWTLDEGRAQPMWSIVTISFKFIGNYRAEGGGPVLSDDKGGFFQIRS